MRLLSVAVVEMATMLGVVEAVGGEGKKERRVLPSLLPSLGTHPPPPPRRSRVRTERGGGEGGSAQVVVGDAAATGRHPSLPASTADDGRHLSLPVSVAVAPRPCCQWPRRGLQDRGREVERVVQIVTYRWAHMGTMLTQMPRHLKPETIPSRNLVCTVL